MGVPGLINALGTGERISLSKLAITHLERTSRPIRIAVDISIWLFQVQAGRGGKNPELRTLFYRLLKILALPIHPLFVYDGKDKPPFKRGKAVSGRSYGNAPIIQLSKKMIDLFRFPRHDAPGEAEAECSRLQKAGVVDAVMSNDVDALMFGSAFTVMNFSKEAGSGAGGATHVTSYKMGTQDANVKLDRPGMILFAMLSGGDYLPSGVPKCGSKLAAEIAKAGFGGDLLEIIEADGAEHDAGLNEWRDRLQYELEENESGYFQTKHKVVRIPEEFPDRTILSYYAKPVVSSDHEIQSLRYRLRTAWDREVDVWQLRQFAADAFEWNYRSGARKVIRLLAEPLVSYRLRLGQQPVAYGGYSLSNSNVPVLQRVYKSRTSFSTDGQTELQLDMIPIDIVGLDLMAEEPNPPMPSQTTSNSGDEEDDGDGEEVIPQSPTKKRVTKRYDPYAIEKVWIFETLALMGVPDAVENWKKEQEAKQAKESAPKKTTTTKKPGLRRRKELDPGMKQGSILKYGTLKKGRSDMTEYKSAQLFEAAVSTSSPSNTPPFSSPGTYGLTMSTPPKLGQRADGFDYLVEQFASCELSGSPVKRRPVTRPLNSRRAAISSTGVDVVDFADEEESPPATPRIRMSYSNASYRETHCHSYFKEPFSPSPPRSKPRREQTLPNIEGLQSAVSTLELSEGDVKATKKSPKKTRSKPKESENLDHTISSLELGLDDCHITEESPKKPRTKLKEPETPVDTVILEPGVCDESTEEPKPRRRQRSAKSKTSTPSVRDTQAASRTEASATRSVPTHLESISTCNGYWNVDTNLRSDDEEQATDPDARNQDKKKKKRIPRVSIVDLTL